MTPRTGLLVSLCDIYEALCWMSLQIRVSMLHVLYMLSLCPLLLQIKYLVIRVGSEGSHPLMFTLAQPCVGPDLISAFVR